MTIKELREKTDVELERMLGEFRGQVRDFRFRLAARQLTDVRDLRDAKRVIARILTEKTARAAKTVKKVAKKAVTKAKA
jgi:ribosomal protein L29